QGAMRHAVRPACLSECPAARPDRALRGFCVLASSAGAARREAPRAGASSPGLVLKPDVSFDDCPQLDVLCIPGGAGVNALMADEATLAFIKRQAERARFVTSVCTGALVLGAAGLLKGKRATTHWASHHLLASLGAIPIHARVVRDGNLMTGGGVTAGIDFAPTLIAELAGREVAEAIALNLEYAPAPPFDAGSPETAPAAVVDALRKRMAPILEERGRLAE